MSTPATTMMRGARRLVAKPATHEGGLPFHGRLMALLAMAAFVVVAVDVALAAGNLVRPLAVVALSIAVAFGELTDVRWSDDETISVGDTLYLTAFAILAPSDALATLAVVAAIIGLSARSWWQSYTFAASILIGPGFVLAAQLGVRRLLPAGPPEAFSVLAGAIAFLIWVVFGVPALTAVLGQRPVVQAVVERLDRRCLVHVHQLVLAACLATLASLASFLYWFAPVLVLPVFGALWIAMSHSVRLVHAEQEARTDHVTELMNRAAMSESLAATCADPSLTFPPVAIMLDLDRFKLVNDSFGHAAGDELLREAGRILREQFTAPHLASRWGGEEFLVLMRGCSLDRAAAAAERARARMATEFEVWESSASFGVAVLRAGETWDDLVARADAALYAAKQAGRNRVVVDDEPNAATEDDSMPNLRAA